MVSNEKRQHVASDSCDKCGSDIALVSGVVVELFGVSVRAPESMKIAHCHGCGTDHLTPAQFEELHQKAHDDQIGYGPTGRPVTRNT